MTTPVLLKHPDLARKCEVVYGVNYKERQSCHRANLIAKTISPYLGLDTVRARVSSLGARGQRVRVGWRIGHITLREEDRELEDWRRWRWKEYWGVGKIVAKY